jgi:3-methylfumaryl-CoA hydratase
MSVNIGHLKEWIGRTELAADEVTRAPLAALSATLDRDDPPTVAADPVPPLWHWLYFLPMHRQSELGDDGHAKLGSFLPSVPLPRRMYAGGRLEFLRQLRVGETISRTSRVMDVSLKDGRTGPLVFVLVRHEISNQEGLALIEEHDIVYRNPAAPTDPAPKPQMAPTDADWSAEIRPDAALLFRYSALTFNAFRIHYDYKYTTEVEKYPGLVVHGPLIATLLADLLRRNMPDAVLRNFSFRAVKALFDVEPFHICGKAEAGGLTVKLWAKDASGSVAMDATAAISR